MKIHTDTLTSSQLYAAQHGLPVYLESVQKGSRSRARAFDVHLSADKDEAHRFNTNFYPNDRVGDAAATWDEWGIWIDRLFMLDPEAIIGQYDGVDDFYSQTRNAWESPYNTDHKPGSVWARAHTAPWLTAA